MTNRTAARADDDLLDGFGRDIVVRRKRKRRTQMSVRRCFRAQALDERREDQGLRILLGPCEFILAAKHHAREALFPSMMPVGPVIPRRASSTAT